jgi:thiol-disulfide isomerase/thioredoxin
MEKLNLIILQADSSNLIGMLFIFFICYAAAISIFLITRALVLWYWKIDVVVGLLAANNNWQVSSRQKIVPMKSKLLLLMIIALQLTSFRSFAQANVDDILIKANEKFNEIKTISYCQNRIVSEPSASNFNTYAGTVYLDFTSPVSIIDCWFQFEKDNYLLIYNGTEDFEIDKKNKSIALQKVEYRLFDGYSFLNHSFYTIKKFLPVLIKSPEIRKTISDTVINKTAFYKINFSIPDKLVENLGDYRPTMKGFVTTYSLLLNKTSFMPYSLLRTNNLNKDNVEVLYSDIKVNPPAKSESSWYYSSYLNEYKLITPELIKLVQPGTAIETWTLPSLAGNQAVSLKDFGKSKLILLEFWIKNCGVCISAVPQLNELAAKYSVADLQIVGINAYDALASVRQYAATNKVNYTILYGGDDFRKKLGVTGFPTVILVDKNGRVVYSGIFDKDEISKVLKSNI